MMLRTPTAVFIILSISLLFCRTNLSAQSISGNPIIKHIRSADPSAHVWKDGKVWVYTSHDQDDADSYQSMDGYHVFSSSDMVNWTDHGEILHSRNVSWTQPGGGWMFAPTAAYKDGIYYFYFPTMAADWKWRVGVATSMKPEGPYSDIGHYIEGPDQIDPCCFMDDDGSAYLIWGGDGNGPFMARLKENMIELAEEPRVIDYGFTNFGEGPYMHKKDDIYYFSYTCHTCQPYQGYYAMGDNPYGPFEYMGELNLSPPGAQDHHSMIEYHGQWYYFYHRGDYMGGSLHRRNVCVDSLFYNPDGSMREVVQSNTGVGLDLIGSTHGELVPGVFPADSCFQQGGVLWQQDGEDQDQRAVLSSGDSLVYILEVLGDDEYTLHFYAGMADNAGSMEIIVDGESQDTLELQGGPGTMQSSLYLDGGKRIFELHFKHPDPDLEFLILDSLSFSSDIVYHGIHASASTGGSIYPDGMVYAASGDSLSFRFRNFTGYAMDSLSVDGLGLAPTGSYTFRDIDNPHSIRAWYSPCYGAELEAWYSAGGGEWQADDAPVLAEGQRLGLRVEFPGEGQVTWTGPDGRQSRGAEFIIDELRLRHAGDYTASVIFKGGCESRTSIHLEVEAMVLDVYQAEEWLDQQGVDTEACEDLGGGLNVGFINHGDWCSYSLDLPESGIYAFYARVATAQYGGLIKVMQDGGELASLRVSPELSLGWQDWYTTDTVELSLEKGPQQITLLFKGTTQYMFNLNWFNLELRTADPSGISKTEPASPLLDVYQHGDRYYHIEYSLPFSSSIELYVISASGQRIANLRNQIKQDPGSYSLHWSPGENFASGFYLLVLDTDSGRLGRRIIL